MSDETSTAVAGAPKSTAYERVFEDPFGGNPINNPLMDVVKAEIAEQIGTPVTTEDDHTPGVEMSAEEIVAQFGTSKKETEPVAEAEAEPESEDTAFDELLANLNEMAGKALGANATPAPAVVTPEPVAVAPPAPVAPVAVPKAYVEEMTSDELLDVITDPEKHRDYMNAFAQKVRLDTMADMQSAMFAASFEAIHAERYAEEVSEKYPKAQSEAGNLVILAYQQAKQKFPNGTYRQIADEANKSIGAVMSKKAKIEKSGQQKDVRGRFAPQSTRTARPAQAEPPKSPTQEAFGMINSISQGPGSDILRLFG